MQTIVIGVEESSQVRDEYLGYRIREVDGAFVAYPRGWCGEVLAAESLPAVRREVWRWWHLVQGPKPESVKASR